MVQTESRRDIAPALFHSTLIRWLSQGSPFAMDYDAGDHVWNGCYDGARFVPVQVELKEPELQKLNGYHGSYRGGSVQFWRAEILAGERVEKRYRYWIETREGHAINSGWVNDSANPDFLWRPRARARFRGPNPRNPFVKPEIVRRIYERSI